ncbi:MAG: helix-turn-helix transcriptional regulator [Lachnospiraceae bacterium]|jgi:transcriptional regulator with XRE-family HTH domain|nr:helix-turn-helix transcriptional regulator [Lachnospiraceae bacterium]SFT57274.1 DNA-binding transcriptional regulator, XRE-family HTH domain [Lachnospiraceae bacterium XBD2001]MBQ1721494.1 helix-turn-helix transcriptional regulator [Lachnospiraceae bacterium]MBQ2318125.1 helix-turn-helix transcriptional regulator [Lachnospiraceae bacterium]MBQ2467371.1 helix-turn-helix transcriptional regulator [Lachnospiraceae bacterium]
MKKRYESDLLPKQYADARIGLATQLRQARIAKHMTQQAVAELAGTQRSNISRMESGKYNPSLDFMVKVAEAMDLELNIFVN